jgi:hypothetical protein
MNGNDTFEGGPIARCSANDCNRWRPGVRHVSGVTSPIAGFSRVRGADSSRLLLDMPEQGIPDWAVAAGVLLRHYRAVTAKQLDEACGAAGRGCRWARSAS